MNKEEFSEWRSSKQTKEIFERLDGIRKTLEFQVVRTVGEDGKQDLIKRGYVLALDDLLNIQFEEDVQEVQSE